MYIYVYLYIPLLQSLLTYFCFILSINSGEAKNKVVVSQKVVRTGKTKKLGELSKGEQYWIQNPLFEARILFESLTNDLRDALVSVYTASVNRICDGRTSGFLTLIITNDAQPDNSWTLTKLSDQSVVARGGPYDVGKEISTVITPFQDSVLCLTPGDKYEFKLWDSYGDGIVCYLYRICFLFCIVMIIIYSILTFRIVFFLYMIESAVNLVWEDSRALWTVEKFSKVVMVLLKNLKKTSEYLLQVGVILYQHQQHLLHRHLHQRTL